MTFEHMLARRSIFISRGTMPHISKVIKETIPHYQHSETFAEFKRHCVHLLAGSLSDDATLDCICSDVINGKSVLVCCNTVGRSKKSIKS